MSVSTVKITDTTLRDGHQSLLATRMRSADMLPIAAKIDQVGFHSLEVWGGATFDACLRFLDEDPWERLQALKKAFKQTPLQMLLRGQNLVGYKHYPDDVVREFVKAAVRNGIDIIRIFDALNDVRNMEVSMDEAKRQGAHVQASIVYTISPVHAIDSFVEMAKTLAAMGADSLCIKDMAGLITPAVAAEFVSRLKKEVGLPVQVHSHYTSGMASMAYLKAVEAGADVLDTAFSPLALGTSQPPTETMAAVLRDTPYDTGLDPALLAEIAAYFREMLGRYDRKDVIGVDTNVLFYQIPGGMVSNLVSQLSESNSLAKLPAVLEEVPRVRAELGYPPLVTPTSQIVGTQAVVNVITGERYKMIPNEVKAYVRGLYGRPPAAIDEAIVRKIIGDEPLVTVRPADLLAPGMEQAAKEAAPFVQKDEDVLTYALFPAVAEKFLRERLSGKYEVDFSLVDEAAAQGDTIWYPA
ncbi:MAG: oxaloacetate decarboxylase subunit alpha [bacterium]|jgi:oxaloacetate decarboxylase alpha subunit